MTFEPGTPIVEPPAAEPGPEKKPTKTWLIVLVVVLALCCLCLIALGIGYFFVLPLVREWAGLTSLLTV